MKGLLSRVPITHINIITAIIYVFVFRAAYENCLCDVYGYYGFKLENKDSFAILLSNIIAFLPILLYRPQRKVSDFIAIVIYVIVYVPTIISLQCYYRDYSFSLPYQLAYLFATCLFFLASKNIYSFSVFRKNNSLFRVKPFITLGVFVFLFTIVLFNTNIQLVSFDDVYGLRESGSSIANSIPIYDYLYSWMPNVFSPLLVAIGCMRKNKILVIIGFLMAILYYATCGMKAALFIPLVSYLVFKYLERDDDNIKYIFPFLTLGVIIPYYLFVFADSSLVRAVIGLLLMRTYGISAFLTPIYIDVFQEYPYTYYSHVRIVDAIFGMYPFKTHSLGNEVAAAYGAYDAEANMNANFLITDGIAAGGVWGVVFIAIVFYFFLLLLNKLSNRIQYYAAMSMMAGVAISLTNISLFTTILSSGMILLLVFLRYTKIQ